MEINGDPFSVLSERDPAKLPWRELGADCVIESSGVFRHIADLEKHLAAGAGRVLLTVPSKDALPATLVTGVNDEVVNIEFRIISNASCTTNCTASLAKVLNDSFACAEGC
jgi:glyceraldehyde 3-phosphate dehydrogenase